MTAAFLVDEVTRLQAARDELFAITRGMDLSVPALIELRDLLFVKGFDDVDAALQHLRAVTP